MCRRLVFLAPLLALFCGHAALATIFGNLGGVVHDPQHRPVAGAQVTLKAIGSAWEKQTSTSEDGEFAFSGVPIGDYLITVALSGFDEAKQMVTVYSTAGPVVHIQLKLASVQQTVSVSAESKSVPADSSTPTTLVNRTDVERTPGADRSNSLAIITDFVPGSYFTHDQLHIRGGHQVTWLVDGVPVPNTNIAGNVGPQIDPKDIDYLEVQRGSYDAEYGDRTYGVFNVVPRTGFERANLAEVVTGFGNFYQSNDQINFGSHTRRFAYYASLNGNRSDLGLESPVGKVLHDRENGFGGFGSLLLNLDPSNQLRLVTSARRDYYQIPNSPSDQAAGIRDGQHEADAFVNFSWVHTFHTRLLLIVSPFYHFNSADFEGGAHDLPSSTTDEHSSQYAGGQATLSAVFARNEAQAGFYGFGQGDRQVLALRFNSGGGTSFRDVENLTGSLAALFVEDKFKIASWLTLSGGVRQTHFSGSLIENSTSPRVGAAVKLPRLRWVFRGFYGHFYQAPPLITASGPALAFVTSQNLGFIPLRGERDEEHQFGVTIPIQDWFLDADTFRTRARNFFDHNSVGNSNIFFPLSIDGALVRGWELTLRSPRLWRRAQLHLAYSNQVAEGRGAITGGLTDFSPPSGYFLLDHDQRNTLDVGCHISLPWRTFAATNVYYGSGFSNGAPPPSHLPGHTTFDLSLGKDFGESFSTSVNGLNVANRHLLLDNSPTFGGTHFNGPREIYVELRYRFHY